MIPPIPNIYWRDAISECLPIITVGRAFVAHRGADRLRIFWQGEEADLAIATMDAYVRHNTTTGGHNVQK